MIIFLISVVSLYVMLHVAAKRAVDNADYSLVHVDRRYDR